SSNNGDFSEVDPEYGVFAWEYQIVREEIQTSDPLDLPKDKSEIKKRELFRLTLTVRPPGDDPIVLEAEFPTTPPQPPTDPAKGDPKDPTKDPGKQTDGPTSPGGFPK